MKKTGIMKKTLYVALPLIGAIMFSGCATLFGGGGKQQITINAEKPVSGKIGYITEDNATIINQQQFTAPATVTVIREDKDIMITSDSNEFEPVKVEKELNPWFWGDVLATSLVSTTTDVVTGAMWKYDENVTIPTK
ncbi:MAG: hypothetical protein WC390_05980 [Sulfurimonas sp.]|jgi:hypothetical protein